MLWLAAHAFVVSVWALIYWGTIKILDRYNVKNTFGVALCIGALYAFSFSFPLPGFVMIAAWLVLLMRVTMWHFELNLGGAAIALFGAGSLRRRGRSESTRRSRWRPP